jgi:hypothetical protein
MGGKWRRRNYQQNHDFNSQSSSRRHEPLDIGAQVEDLYIGSYKISGRGGRHNANRIPFCPDINNRHRHHDPNPGSTSWHPREKQFQRHSFPPRFAQNEFRIGSNRFKQYLLQSINQTLQQIQQWYPDEEISSDDGMDWQPELVALLVKEQPTEAVHYIWDPDPLPKTPVVTEGVGMQKEAETESPTAGRRKAASEGNNGVSLEETSEAMG